MEIGGNSLFLATFVGGNLTAPEGLHTSLECSVLTCNLLVLDALALLVARVVAADLVVVSEEQVQEDAGDEANAAATCQDEAGEHTGDTFVDLVEREVEADLRADVALDRQNDDEHRAGGRGCCHVQRVHEQADGREDDVGAGTIVDGVHALAAGLLVALVGSDAVRCGQRAGLGRVAGDEGDDDVTEAADHVGAVRVELDVLVVALGLVAELLDGDEVAVGDDHRPSRS